MVEMHLLRAVLGCRIKDCVLVISLSLSLSLALFHPGFVLVIILKLGGLKFVRIEGIKRGNWEFRV
jgi:hypothetical protein